MITKRFLAIVAIALYIALVLVAGCVNTQPQTAKDSVKVTDAGWTVRTNLLAATKTYTVEGTFTNQGSRTYTFFGGLTLYNSDYEKLGDYKGETMTLAPGQSKTISVVFVTDYSTEKPAGVTYKVS
jgi:hypothetical protein